MATSYSPKIITDGLVLCLDAADKKSLLAPPTTNLANNSNGTINWTTGNLVGTRTQSTVDANDYHYRFVLDKGSNSSISFRFSFDHTNLTNGETYIMSYKYKITSGSGTFYVTDFCDVGVTRVTQDIGDGWYYETAYASRSSYTETYDFFDVRASDNMTVDIKEIQVEHTSASSPLATPFVSYQRQWKDRAGSNNGAFVNMNDQSGFSSEGRGSLIFDGVNDHATAGNFFNYQAFAISLWVKPASSQVQYADILDNNHTGAQNWVLQQNSTTQNQYSFNVFGASYQNSVTGNFNLTAGVWVNLTFTYDGTKVRGYNNGVLFATGGALGTTINYSNQSFNIGRWGAGGRYWEGEYGIINAYNRALTASEILQNYNATKGRFGL